jgi:phosphoribosyl 1,2-cyclic phosphate phosphodiesterase
MLTILGCGSSGGVPRVGQGWGVCDPANPKNRRRRCSVLLRQVTETEETTVLVDTGPDVREQLLDAQVSALDGIIYTHDHADHTHGIDDIRPIVLHGRRRVDAFMDSVTAAGLTKRFGYIFHMPSGGDYPPILFERQIESGVLFAVSGAGGSLPVMPFRLHHGSIDALGLRIGRTAYTPDVHAIPDESLPFLGDLDLWIIDALRIKPHPSHFHLEQALGWIERMKPRRAILTNLHSDLDYDTLCRTLPAHVEPGFDGLEIEIV